MAVIAEGYVVSKQLSTTGAWEIQTPQELADLAGKELPPPGSTFPDVGANLNWVLQLSVRSPTAGTRSSPSSR